MLVTVYTRARCSEDKTPDRLFVVGYAMSGKKEKKKKVAVFFFSPLESKQVAFRDGTSDT